MNSFYFKIIYYLFKDLYAISAIQKKIKPIKHLIALKVQMSNTNFFKII